MRALVDKLRAWPWLAGAAAAAAVVAWIAPWQLGVLVWSLAKLSGAAYLGYWMDRSVFPYARPGDAPAETLYAAACMLRRAVIIAASVIAVGLGG